MVKGYNSSNFEQDLAAGDAWIAQAYNGNMTFVMRDEPRIRYVIPKEGCHDFRRLRLHSAPRSAPAIGGGFHQLFPSSGSGGAAS